MSELRQDRITGEWVIIAPERRQRPHGQMATEGHAAAGAGNCPFCPGNEALLPGIIDETRQEAPPGWRTRVVPNRYPLMSAGEADRRPPGGAHRALPSRGRHEVIIESPHHEIDIPGFSDEEIDATTETWHRRYTALSRLPGIEAVVIFRNYGRRAGASLDHPHSQAVGLCMTPPRWRSTAARENAVYRDHGYCVTCDEIAAEQQGVRAVEDCGGFLALVPYAATNPFELWLIPKRHNASFCAARPDELTGLGRLLRRSIRRIETVLGAVPYKLVIDSAARPWANAPYLHWKLRIVPDPVTSGGFELGTGLPVNPSLPEADAEALRLALTNPERPSTLPDR